MHVINFSVIFTLLKLSVALSAHAEDFRKKFNIGFIFTTPRVFMEGKNEIVCMTFHDAPLPIKAKIDLKIKDKHFITDKLFESEHTCFEQTIPWHNKTSPQYLNFKVQVLINNVVHSAHNQDPLLIYPHKKLTFIETDRYFYKPGDKIKFRILILEPNLLPPKEYKISEVRVRNPLDISVSVWDNVTTDTGLVELEHEMTKEAVMGKWKIEANGESKVFEVKKYILPRYQVQLIHPETIYYKDDTVAFKVCAKYPHGKNVEGEATVKVSDTHHNMQQMQTQKKMKNGCADISFKNSELALSGIRKKFPMYDPKIHMLVTTTVKEIGTDATETETSRILINLKKYNIKFVSENVFRPGIPYEGKIRITGNEAKKIFAGEVLEICYNMAIKKSWNYLNSEECSNVTLSGRDDEIVDFYLPPLKSNVIHVHLNARSLNNTNIGDSFLLVRLFSNTNSYIFLRQNESHGKCSRHHNTTIVFTTEKFSQNETVTFYYIIKSRGEIHKLGKFTHFVNREKNIVWKRSENTIGRTHKFVSHEANLDIVVLKYKLDEKIIYNYELLVYYVLKTSGETIATSAEFAKEPCLRNKVEAHWNRHQFRPGEKAVLNIRSNSESLCAVSAVDASTLLMGSLSNLNDRTVLKEIFKEKDSIQSGRRSCIPPRRELQISSMVEYQNRSSAWELRRRKRHVYPFAEDFDTFDVFNKFGINVISNLKIVTKRCYTGPDKIQDNPVQFLTDQYSGSSQEKTVQQRSYFPENWLWELIPVRNYSQIHRIVPHSITTWSTSVICVSADTGVGFIEPINITSFQPFFVDVLAPYSIKREEILYLRVVVFNYLDYSVPIRLTLGNTNGLHLTSDRRISYCLPSNASVTRIFQMTAVEMGEETIKILAEIDPSYPRQCGPETLINMRDIVTKTINVEAEGYPVKSTHSALICGSDSQGVNNLTWYLLVPLNSVKNSANAKLVFNGDLMSQTVENIDELLTLPTGCGEQIMSSMAPNLYVIRYLSASNRLTHAVRQKAIKNLKIGYQRILNYMQKDGSFSPFGYHDRSGSMFLTAFVVRILQNAKEYIYVDQKVIDRAVAWIFDHQLENGCFNTMLHVFQDMGGTTTENSTSALTSYVIISLLEAKIDLPEKIMTNAKYCIRGYFDQDKYTLAISSYALYKVSWFSEATRMLKRMMQTVRQEQNMMWWDSRENDSSASADIEITSYMLLSLLFHNTTENLANAHAIVRWLSTRRGPNGGFQSTQDTVVALDALSKYAALVNSKAIALEIQLDALNQHQTFKIRNEDRMKTKRIHLKEPTNNLMISVRGEGCLHVQAVLEYYVKDVSESDSFKVAMEVAAVSTIDKCSIATLSPCVSYNGPETRSNMAVMEIKLPSGYEADRASLYRLTESESETKVKMFEEIKNKVVFYITKLGKRPVCIAFNINENSAVERKSESPVKVYDYYKPQYESLQFYQMHKECQQALKYRIPQLLAEPSMNSSSENEENGQKENVISPERLKRGLNPDFVDKNVDLDAPDCRNHEYYSNFSEATSQDSTRKREKRTKALDSGCAFTTNIDAEVEISSLENDTVRNLMKTGEEISSSTTH